MRILVDTNVLTRTADVAHPHHPVALAAMKIISARDDVPCIVPQNLYEFWVVCTRPVSENGLGMNTNIVRERIRDLKQALHFLDDVPGIVTVWEELAASYQVQGKSAHDARLIAAMTVHGLTDVLTFNHQHFRRYQGITVRAPESIVGSV